VTECERIYKLKIIGCASDKTKFQTKEKRSDSGQNKKMSGREKNVDIQGYMYLSFIKKKYGLLQQIYVKFNVMHYLGSILSVI
jgi:hypothetical protein